MQKTVTDKMASRVVFEKVLSQLKGSVAVSDTLTAKLTVSKKSLETVRL